MNPMMKPSPAPNQTTALSSFFMTPRRTYSASSISISLMRFSMTLLRLKA